MTLDLAPMTLDGARAADAADPLCHLRDRFLLPEGQVYLDGNSLGALPRATVARMQAAVTEEWGTLLVGGWRSHWIEAPQRVGTKIARLIGARPHEVIVADSVTVNLFKLITAAALLRPDRSVLLSELGNFATDLYVAGGAAEARPPLRLEAVARDDVAGAIGADTNLVLLTHVHYKTAERFDMAALTARARDVGAALIWDLSHSAGAVPIDLHADGVELAVGCGYKYLNGGPGAPSFLYVAEHLQERLEPLLRGWMGHAEPFAFADDYQPAPGIDRFLCGTPPILSLIALESGVETFAGVTMDRLWTKSVRLFDLFHRLVERACPELDCITPAAPEQRGSHISFRHPHAYQIVQALIARGVIGDFRAPDVARFGLTPLYTGAQDVVRAVACMAAVLGEESWRDPRYAVREKVT